MFTLKLNKPFLMKRAVKFMNVEQVDYVAGISHKGPVLVLHDDYMLEHGTFLEFTNDLDSQNMYRIKVATTPSPLQWTNSSKVSGKTDFFFKVSLSDEAQIYLSCSKYFILRTWRLFPVPATDEGLTKSLGDCFSFKNLFKVSNLFLNEILLN